MSRIHEALKRAEEEVGKERQPFGLENDVALTPTGITEISPAPMDLTPSELEPTKGGFGNHDWLDTLPRSSWNPDPKRIVFADPKQHSEYGMEEFRTLRSRLYQIRERKPLKIVMLSSAVSGEGKTFIASNLAFVLARQQGRRVLLIDADVRKPLLHESIRTAGSPGLNDYLAGKATAQSIVQRGPLEDLFLVPGGEAVSNPAELIGNGKLNDFLSKVRPLFDWILLDSPPLVPVSDGSIISRLADGILLVVKANTTPVELTERAKEELKGLPILGVILNRGERNSRHYSSYHYAYSYTKGPRA